MKYLTVVVGVVLSVALPWAVNIFPRNQEMTYSIRDDILKNLKFIVGSLIIGFAVVYMQGQNITSWEVGVSFGFAWDSAIQRIRDGKSLRRFDGEGA